MKRLFIALTLGLMLLIVACGPGPKRASFFTQGNCPECEALIIEALEGQKGVDSVGWDFEMGLTVVKFHPDKVLPDQLQQHLAASGFSTQFYPADTLEAKKLPACCQEAVSRKLKRKELIIPSH
ncbi:MAG: cation transporter [Bacteroidia bacterium]